MKKSVFALRTLAFMLCMVLTFTALGTAARAEEKPNYAVYSDECIKTAQVVAFYVMGANNLMELKSRLEAGSEAMRLMNEYGKWGRASVGSQTLGPFVCSQFKDLGDDCFSVHVSAVHLCSFKTLNDCVFHIEYTMFFKVKSGMPLLYDLKVESEDGQDEVLETPDDGLKLTRVYRKAFRGYVLEISDPSRVFVGVASRYWSSPGKTIDRFCSQYGAVAGVNANGFDDPGGRGTGAAPNGLVITQGELMHGGYYGYGVAGFDANNVLHVGYFDGPEATKLGLRDAVSFKPILIKDGEAQDMSKVEQTGLNGRTAIGQKADGTVLLVVLEGAQSDSPGAEITDLVDLMLEYGAVNACNMDGGPSSVMYVDGERLSGNGIMTGFRNIPCAILVKPQ